MSVATTEYLAQYGFNPQERQPSSSNLETYALHVVEDRPVSNRYCYFTSSLYPGKIFIDENFTKELYVDPEERGGLACEGTMRAVESALHNSGKVIFLYSPPGPVAFTSGTKYDKVIPYPAGQLYLLVSEKKDKVDVLAISVSRRAEEKFLRLLGIKISGGFDDEVEKISYYLSYPQVSNWDFDSLLSHLDKISSSDDFIVYINVRGKEYPLSSVVEDLRKGWLREIKPKFIRNTYREILQAYVPLYADGDGWMRLGGSCGGAAVNVKNLFGLDFSGQLNPLSTDWRVFPTFEPMKTKVIDTIKCVTCPFCHQTVDAEIVEKDGEAFIQCPKCGEEVKKS